MENDLADLPRFFYKYRSLSGQSFDFTKKIVLDSELYWSSPLDFNDPFDSSPTHRVIGNRRKQISFYRQLMKRHNPNQSRNERRRASLQVANRPVKSLEDDVMLRQRMGLVKQSGVCCLTTKDDSILMWSHYSDAHRGVCIKFDIPLDDLENISDDDIYFELAWRVKYSRLRPRINILKENRDDLLRDLFLTKSDIWSYEEEWRLITKDGPGSYRYPHKRLVGIILGANISAENEKQVRNWLSDVPHPIKLQRAVPDRDTFSLNIVDV